MLFDMSYPEIIDILMGAEDKYEEATVEKALEVAIRKRKIECTLQAFTILPSNQSL